MSKFSEHGSSSKKMKLVCIPLIFWRLKMWRANILVVGKQTNLDLYDVSLCTCILLEQCWAYRLSTYRGLIGPSQGWGRFFFFKLYKWRRGPRGANPMWGIGKTNFVLFEILTDCHTSFFCFSFFLMDCCTSESVY